VRRSYDQMDISRDNLSIPMMGHPAEFAAYPSPSQCVNISHYELT
jgi:hypothetical protein